MAVAAQLAGWRRGGGSSAVAAARFVREESYDMGEEAQGATAGQDYLSRKKKQMKRPIFLLVALLLFAGAGFNCRRTKPSPSPLTGKLVVNGLCGFNVVQVLSGNVDSSRLVKSWKYTTGDTTFSNVFMVNDPCTFGGYGLSKNDEFTFEMNDTVIVQNCMLCMIAWPPTPAVANTVSEVQLVKKGQ